MGTVRISKVTATPVLLKLTRPAATSMGSGSAVTRTIVEVETDAGIVGLGETGGAHAAQLVGERFAPKILGRNPLDRSAIRRSCVPSVLDYGTVEQPAQLAAYAGIELALWDIAGQAARQPLYELLGGAVRERAPFVAYAFTVESPDCGSPAEIPVIMAKIAAAEIAATGASMFEFKVARHSVSTDIDTVLAVRAALGPHLEIAVDANMRYSLAQARQFLKATGEARLSNIEEPCASLSDCSRIGQEFGISVSSHCMDFDAIRYHAGIDGLVGGLDAQGGISRIVELALGATALGRQYWLRSCVESGIAWAAMAHLGIACPALERPSQALIQWLEDDLVTGDPWLVRNGGVIPPPTPGLGVTLDRTAFERMAEEFKSQGEKSYFDKA